jgi:predicted NAD/FAD-binding protein
VDSSFPQAGTGGTASGPAVEPSAPTAKHDSGQLSRRAALAALGGTAIGVAARPGAARAGGPEGSHVAVKEAAVRQRIAVVGGGISGVSLAWMLDGEHDVIVLERGAELGGHVSSIDMTIEGKKISVDAGAQYFGPKSHPAYWRLLTKVLEVPTVAAPMNLTLHRRGENFPVLVSPDRSRTGPLFDPRYWTALTAMAAFTDKGKQIAANNDWTTTAEQFIESLFVVPSLREKLLYPLAGSMFGFSVPQVKQMSAHAVVAFVIRGLGDGFLAPYDYYNATGGLEAVIAALRSQLATTTFHTGAAATGISRQGSGYEVRDAQGRVHVADHVVFALPPYAAGPLAGQLAGTEAITAAYKRFTYIPARVAIHADPAYMPKDKVHWSAYNVLSDGEFCEPTMWFGGFRGVNVFKSWISHRRELPRDILHTVDYLHAHETPGFARAQAALGAHQGTGNLWFAGCHMTDVASQESGLLSAARVARRLAPASKNLASLGL